MSSGASHPLSEGGQQDQPLLVSSEQGSSAQEAGASQQDATSHWRTSLTSSLAALRRAFSRDPDSQRVASSDLDSDTSGAGTPSPPPGEVDLEQPAAASSGAAAAAGAAAGACRSGSGEIGEAKPGSPKLGRLGSRNQEKVCLICLETLTPEDFEAGRAISLECNCRGDLALRHKECAIKWAQVKGDLLCELCKAPVRNLPALPPRPAYEGETDEHYMPGDHAALMDLTPSYADLVFDCIRVTWVAMIVSILFFEMQLGSALLTGLVAGLAYSVMVKIMYRQHYAAMQRMAEQQQAAAQAARGEAQQRAAGTAAVAPPPAGQQAQQGLQVVVVSAQQ